MHFVPGQKARQRRSLANPWPMETILLPICLEQGKIIEEILDRLKQRKS